MTHRESARIWILPPSNLIKLGNIKKTFLFHKSDVLCIQLLNLQRFQSSGVHLGTAPTPVCLDILKRTKHQAPNTALHFNSGMIMNTAL